MGGLCCVRCGQRRGCPNTCLRRVVSGALRKLHRQLRERHAALSRKKTTNVIDREGEVEVLSARQLEADNPNQLTVFIEHSSAATPWRGGCTCLEQLVSLTAVSRRANHTLVDGEVQTLRRSDENHLLSDLHLSGVTKRCRCKVERVDLEQHQVSALIDVNYGHVIVNITVQKCYRDLGVATDHAKVCNWSDRHFLYQRE